MAFVVEDGTGLATANSYAAVVDADAYFAERNQAAWSGTQAQKEAALILATDYIDGRFWGQFLGVQATDTQALSWPRTGTVYASDAVPVPLERATFEYALRALVSPLAPDIVTNDAGVVMVTTKQEVGGAVLIERTPITSGIGSKPMLFRPYPAADMLIARLIVTYPGVIRA